MPFVEHEELYAALITVFAVFALFMGGWDISVFDEK